MSLEIRHTNIRQIPSFKGVSFASNQADFESFKNQYLNNLKYRQTNSQYQISIPVEKKEPEQEKVGTVQKFKNIIAGIEKIWINIAEYTKGTIVGIMKGALLGGTIYGGLYLPDLWKAKKKSLPVKDAKILPKPVKIAIASAFGLFQFVKSLYNASLNVSERKAKVDHRYNTGHRVE